MRCVCTALCVKEMDIDEILSRAEDQQTQADQSLSLEQELLSKFKVM